MPRRVLLTISAVMYFGLALLVMAAPTQWPRSTGQSLSAVVIGTAALLASACLFLGFAVLKARAGSPGWIRTFGIGGAVLAGTLGGLAGWKAALILGAPLTVGVVGVWRNQLANPAFESGLPQPDRSTQTSPPMRTHWPLTLGSVLYAGLAVFLPVSMFWWTEYTGKPFSTHLFALVAALAAGCAFLAFSGYKARTGSVLWAQSFAVAGAVLVGVTSLANWKALLIFGLPFLIALAGLWNVHKRKPAG